MTQSDQPKAVYVEDKLTAFFIRKAAKRMTPDQLEDFIRYTQLLPPPKKGDRLELAADISKIVIAVCGMITLFL